MALILILAFDVGGSLDALPPAGFSFHVRAAVITPTASNFQNVSRASERKIRRVSRKICVALPAYNEANRLDQLLGRIALTFEENGLDFEIIVVDDGSDDETAEIAQKIAKELPIHLVRHKTNQGLHGAIDTCLRTAVDRCKPQDVIITMDADDTHPPKIIDRMLTAIDEGHDIVIASRYQYGSRVVGVPWHRVVLARIASFMFQCLMPIKGVRDYTSGFRAYRFEPIERAIDFYGSDFVSEQGFSCMVDVLLKMRRFNYVMGEVPIVLRYDQKHGPSKMEVGSTIWKTLVLFAKRRVSGY